jgi:hypothetical protein
MGLFEGIGGILGGLFGHSGKPYDKAMEQYQQWGNRAQQTQQPFLNAGTGAIGNYQQWLQGQKDPTNFINNLMGGYQESPYTRYLQNQAMNAGQNAASASGMLGSTPFLQQQQQNAANISQQGMDDWLSNVLGINQQYGQGQQNLMTGGQNAANALTGLYNQMGQNMGAAAYGKQAGKNQDIWNLIGGGFFL